LVKIEDDILFVHKRLVSTSEILNGDWYSTKDSIEWVTDTTFKIKGRISEDIKVMGHLVSLRKIESLINGYDGVKMCKLIPKVHNVFGNLLICQLLLEDQNLDLKQLKQSLKSQLRKYEMPSKFIIVDNIEMTASGKIKR
jgi:acyl-coenzyme A synthetase/AMP-(fatty) acid ligase